MTEPQPTNPPVAAEVSMAGLEAMASEVQATGPGQVTDRFNLALIDTFRGRGGELTGDLAGSRILLLTTTGARSGRQRTVPLGFVRTGGRTYIVASLGGRPENPAWYHNLVANPIVTVELGAATYQAEAIVLRGEERDRVFEIAGRKIANFAEYQKRTSRVIPVIELRPLGADAVA
jgi:deazaflavin-dependent oxidoreductase (nitroreductase family)